MERKRPAKAIPPAGGPQRIIRLQARYASAEALVREYSRNLARGGCCIVSPQRLEVGTRFVLEMHLPGVREPIEVDAEVAAVEPSGCGDSFLVAIRYQASKAKRAHLDRLIDQLLEQHKGDPHRAHPRLPLPIDAVDPEDPSRRYRVRDVSHGGMSLNILRAQQPPPEVRRGAQVLVGFESGDGHAAEMTAEVVWTSPALPDQDLPDARFGLRFTTLDARAQTYLVRLTNLNTIPSRVTLRFREPGRE